MDERLKKRILIDINSRDFEELIDFVSNGEISLEEMERAALDRQMLEKLRNYVPIIAEPEIGIESENIIMDDPIIEEPIVNIHNSLKYDDKKILELENLLYDGELEKAGYEKHIIRGLEHYFLYKREIDAKKIEDLPPLATDRTDLYFIGYGRAGKSTMLSSLLYTANKLGKWASDVDVHPQGVPLVTTLLKDFANNVIPQATQKGSFNYIAATFKDEKREEHPFNIVEMPGEIWEKIGGGKPEELDSNLVERLFEYLKSDNKKIIMFVLDIDQRDNDAYSDQFVSYPTFLRLFKKWGILKNTEAIYILVNKIDIKDKSFDYEYSKDKAKEIMEQDFLQLLEDSKDLRKLVKNDYKIKLFPFSVGMLKFEKIIDEHKSEYSEILLEHLIQDSFLVKEKWWKKFF